MRRSRTRRRILRGEGLPEVPPLVRGTQGCRSKPSRLTGYVIGDIPRCPYAKRRTAFETTGERDNRGQPLTDVQRPVRSCTCRFWRLLERPLRDESSMRENKTRTRSRRRAFPSFRRIIGGIVNQARERSNSSDRRNDATRHRVTAISDGRLS